MQVPNEFILAGDGNSITPIRPPHFTTRQQAYRFAAWLITMAVTLPNEEESHEFEEILEAVRNS